MPSAHINKVIKFLKFNCNEFSVFLMGGAIERAHSTAKSHSVAISRLRLPSETLQIFIADLNFKNFITLLICAKGT